jgi:hypothetical protein
MVDVREAYVEDLVDLRRDRSPSFEPRRRSRTVRRNGQ